VTASLLQHYDGCVFLLRYQNPENNGVLAEGNQIAKPQLTVLGLITNPSG
jgi:hypothetical protein